MIPRSRSLYLLGILLPLAAHAQLKPITLDEYLNTTEINDTRLSPDGSAAAIATESPDWAANSNRRDIWLWHHGAAAPTPITHTGDNSEPRWSPDGRYLAFVSNRPLSGVPADAEPGKGTDAGKTDRIWLLPTAGGEAFPLYREPLDTHAFAWSPDSATVFFATQLPLSKDAEDARKKDWKDVVQWRVKDRGDVMLALSVAAATQAAEAVPEAHVEAKPDEAKPAYPAGSRVVADSPLAIEEIVPSQKGDQLAFETGPTAHRLEDPADTEAYIVPAAGGTAPRQLTHNQGLEGRLAWDPAGTHLYVLVRASGGSIEGPYQDVQGRLYSIDVASGQPTRLGASFPGSWEDLTVSHEGKLFAVGLRGTNQALYEVESSAQSKAGSAEMIAGTPGTYGRISLAEHGTAMLFTHSAVSEPTQVFLAADAAHVKSPEAITAFNPVFHQRAKPEGRPFRWKATDGTEVEGMLIYPPGKKGAQHLRMLTLIHGGPADADGDRFGANWYDWAGFAAANGWLVFRPNYRGSTGYGDAFMLGISPHLVSAPGRDILAGVDALVQQGIADPDHLAIAGYSYGGYMTNWLLTETTRFKAAMTGAGAVEHAANWGFDDLTFDDAWYLSGAPWEKPEIYQSEAALFRMNKVTTPTHIIGGDADNRVSFFEQIVLERALTRLKVPHALLLFPGENHPLSNNPWHGYIALREEMKWLEKYAGQ